MKFQYITDDKGEPTGVFIPIKEWNDLKSRLKDIDEVNLDIPEWHKAVVRERIAMYKREPNQAQDLDSALDELKESCNV